jgi:hypothetical protein
MGSPPRWGSRSEGTLTSTFVSKRARRARSRAVVSDL